MLDSSVLDVALALVFVFLAVSLAASAAVEAIASITMLRSTTLRSGIKQLLNDPGFNDLAAELYAHALISPLSPGLSGVPAPSPGAAPLRVRAVMAEPATAATRRVLAANLGRNLPAYVQPRQFAAALCDVLALIPADGGAATVAGLLGAIDARLPAADYPQLNPLLRGMVLRTGGDLALLRGELAGWFDNAMDRVGGVYKRHTQLISFVAALFICVVLNADTLQLAQRVWQQPAVMAQLKLGGTAADTLAQNAALARSLPLGWADQRFWTVRDAAGRPAVLRGGPLGMACAGWLITALASLFGAPFWFDALQRITRLRGTGPTPAQGGTGPV